MRTHRSSESEGPNQQITISSEKGQVALERRECADAEGERSLYEALVAVTTKEGIRVKARA